MLWVVVDGLDARRLDELTSGASGPTALGDLLRRGVRFDSAYAAAPWSGASLASALTGRLPSTHGLRGSADVLASDVPVLSEILASAGVHTAAVVSDFRLGAARGFARGWEHFDAEPAYASGRPSSPDVTRAARQWLGVETRGAEPFLLLAHYSDPRPAFLVHDRARLPATAPELLALGVDAMAPEGVSLEVLQLMSADPTQAERAFLEAMLAEEILATDRAIGELLAGLRRQHLDESTWIVVSGGHGLELFEHGWAGDGHAAWQELLHVPLIVVPPGPRRAPRRISASVSLCSLQATLAELLGASAQDTGTAFPSLAPVLRGDDLVGDGFAPFEVDHELASAPPRSPVAHLRGCVSGDWKWVEDLTHASATLVHLTSDPHELSDQQAQQAVRARQLASRLARAVRAVQP